MKIELVVAPAEMAVLLTDNEVSSLFVNTADVPRTCFLGLGMYFPGSYFGSRGAHPSPVVSLVLSWENGFVPFEAVILKRQGFSGGTARKTSD
jgi:hypothetical protein